MADLQDLTPSDVARMARQHVDSLRSAGVEWAPLPSQASPDQEQPQVVEVIPAVGGSQFETIDARLRLSMDQRRAALQVLAGQVSQCRRCPQLVANRSRTVFGVGQIGPDVCFVGEGPGADEDAQGEPFVGAAGQLLNKIIVACGMKREEVYICNIVKCRPPGNRTPAPDEAANCRGFLEQQIDLIRPKFICALGSCAAQNLLNTTTGITKLRGRFYEFRGIPVLCTFHPAYLLRSPDKKKYVWEDMQVLMNRLGRPIKNP